MLSGGILMVEVMEPTDFVARVEFNVAGRTIPESARFMGRDVDFALDMFSYEPMPVTIVQSRWCCVPRVVEGAVGMRRESLVDDRVTDRFNVLRTSVTGLTRWRTGGFTILLVMEGKCTVATKTMKFRSLNLTAYCFPMDWRNWRLSPIRQPFFWNAGHH